MSNLKNIETDHYISLKELVEMVNTIVINLTNKGLTQLQIELLKAIYDRKRYKQMSILIGYSESSIRNEASKLFKILNNSKKLKSVVNKNNLVNILQMYKNDTQINNNIHHNKLVYFIDNELKKQTESSIKQYTLIIESTLDELDMPKIKKLIDCLNETSKDLSIRIIKRE